jgi:hypothetical protein
MRVLVGVGRLKWAANANNIAKNLQAQAALSSEDITPELIRPDARTL